MTDSVSTQAATQLRGYVSRVERLQEEIDALNTDKKEIFGEAKACGLDVPTLKKVVQRRRKDKDEVFEQDTLLELYERIVSARPQHQMTDVVATTHPVADPLEL